MFFTDGYQCPLGNYSEDELQYQLTVLSFLDVEEIPAYEWTTQKKEDCIPSFKNRDKVGPKLDQPLTDEVDYFLLFFTEDFIKQVSLPSCW